MYFEEFTLHETFPIRPARIDPDELAEFARKYDHIRIHTDEAYARTTHFGGIIAPGVMSFMSVWSKYLEEDRFGTELIAGKSTKIEWHRPVYPGDVLTGQAEVSRLVKRSEKNGIVELTVLAYNQNGLLVLSDVTETIVKCRPISPSQNP